MAKIQGILPVLTTPYLPDGRVDLDSLKHEIEVVKQMGSDGTVLFSIAGEYFKQNDEEQYQMLDVAAKTCQALDLPLVASVSLRNTYNAIERVKRYEDAGVDCVMMLPPMNVGGSELSYHVGAVADAIKIPMMMQYCPSHTGTSLSVDDFLKMSEGHDNIEYFKVECVPPGPFTTELIERLQKDATIISGYAGMNLVEMYDRGCVGVMPSVALNEMYMAVHKAYFAGDRAEALRIHNLLIPILNHMGQYSPAWHWYERDFAHRRGIIKYDAVRHPDYYHDKYMDRMADDYFELLKPYLPNYD